MAQMPVSGEPGHEMYSWAHDLFPINRSLTGDGVRQTLAYLAQRLPGLTRHEIPTGQQAFDWTIPREWRIRDAFIADLDGKRLVDFRESNLHVVGYSEPVDRVMSRAELEPHLHSLPDQPDAIPYVTSYYSRNWGFCLRQTERDKLGEGPFHVRIDSELFDGSLTYADLVIPGDTADEVLLTTYVCHPSMANNELSGPVVLTSLGRWLQSLPNRRYTYRLVFSPETIGALAYLSQHLEHLRRQVVAGWVLTCVGDDRSWSFLPSRRGDTLVDRVSRAVLTEEVGAFNEYPWSTRGSDERQYCAPGVDLPFASIMRTKYAEYPEYHTSLDDLSLISPEGLSASLRTHQRCLEVLEANHKWKVTTIGEPQLGKRGLYPTLSKTGSATGVRTMMDVLSYADGAVDLVDLASRVGAPIGEVEGIVSRLAAASLLEAVE